MRQGSNEGTVVGGSVAGQRISLQDVATAAGVSTGTVSLVLNGRPGPSTATATKVLETANRLGFRPDRTASMLASRRTRLLGVTMTPSNPYHAQMVEEIEAEAAVHGYDVLIAAVTRTRGERRAIETLVDSRCEALVLLGPALDIKTLVRAIGQTPATLVGRPTDEHGLDVVRSGDLAAMELLVDHLASLGHTRIAHIDGGGGDLPRERALGYEKAMQARRLDPIVIDGGETWEAGRAAGARFLRHSGLTAAVAYNDQCAVGVIDELYRKGIRVPQDVSVTGFDDDRVAGLAQIDLTTINPSPAVQAHRAAQVAIERADGARTPRIVEAPPVRLTVRGSTAPPPRRRRRPS